MIDEEELQVCPRCGSTDTNKHSFVLTKKYGKRRRRKCKRCASVFYEKMEEK